MATHPTATVPSRAWYGDGDLSLEFPPGWQVTTLDPSDAPALSQAQIEKAFANPIGTRPLAELAQDNGSAAIVIDDLSRPSPAAEILPYVLQELVRGGIPKQEIRIVVGGGSHRPLTDEEVAKKVGIGVAAEYEVTSHDFMSGDLRGLGNLPSGLPIYVNPIVADADLKLCLGGIYPHGSVGFGGGSKLILPGVSGFATMFYFHTFYPGRGHANIESQSDELDNRDVSEAVASVLGLDAVVNMVINSRRQVAGLFVGHYVQAQRAAARFALQVYGTHISAEQRQQTDLVVTNCYPLDSDALQTTKALWMRQYFDKAYTVAINPACDGTCYHGLFNHIDYPRYLRQQGQQQDLTETPARVGDRDQVLVWSETFPAEEFPKKVRNGILFRRWTDIIDQLTERLPENANVAVFPCGGIQVLAQGDRREQEDSRHVSVPQAMAAD